MLFSPIEFEARPIQSWRAFAFYDWSALASPRTPFAPLIAIVTGPSPRPKTYTVGRGVYVS